MPDEIVAGAPAATTPAAPAAPAVPSAPLNVGADAIPAAPSAAAPPAPPPATPGGDEPIVYAPTGDAGLDLALKFVGDRGLDVDHPAMRAAENGDFSLIKAYLASMGDKAQGWEQYVALAEKAVAGKAEAAAAQVAKTTQIVHDAVGGPEAWGQIQAWAKDNADPDERSAINDAFAKGGFIAKAVAEKLANLHRNATGTVVKPAEAVRGGNPSVTANSNTLLNPREYAAAVQELARRVGANKIDDHPEYAALKLRARA